MTAILYQEVTQCSLTLQTVKKTDPRDTLTPRVPQPAPHWILLTLLIWIFEQLYLIYADFYMLV